MKFYPGQLVFNQLFCKSSIYFYKLHSVWERRFPQKMFQATSGATSGATSAYANSIKLLLKEALQTFEIDFTRLKNMEIRPVFPSSDTHKYSESIFLMSSCMRKHNGPILDEKIDTSSSRKMLPFLNLVFLDVSILHEKRLKKNGL